jgi:hypothetical protein
MMTKPVTSDGQRAMLERLRAECYLNKNVPLGFPVAVRPEEGRDVDAYYRHKHATIGPGRFYPLHATKNAHWRALRQRDDEE